MTSKSPNVKDDQNETGAKNFEEFDIKHNIIDSTTPSNVPLSGQYKKSFAYYTFRERLPNTLKSILKTLEETKTQTDLNYSLEELNTVVNQVTQLKHQLENNGQLELFQGNEPDKEVWNTFIRNLPPGENTFYKTCWLYSECYMYRKLYSFFEATQTLKNFDCFAQQKLQALKLATKVMEEVAIFNRNLENNAETFKRLLNLSLWSNRCDLSITSGQEVKPTHQLSEIIDKLNNYILIDYSEKVWNYLLQRAEHNDSQIIIDIICDNAGFELFTDLLMAQHLIHYGFANIVRFHVKAIPWFVSDTTAQDVTDTLNYMQQIKSEELKMLAKEWRQNFVEGKFVLAPKEDFWTSPYEFFRMYEINPELFKTLKESSLLIFKGDLNYRKLLGDFNWDFCQKFETCIRGFRPTNLCILRTVKGDLICELKPGQADKLTKQDSQWMFTGEYGVIQWAAKEEKQKTN